MGKMNKVIENLKKDLANGLGIPSEYLADTTDDIEARDAMKNIQKLNKLLSHFKECEE